MERARYEASRAERSFHAVGPENRLVAHSLEARWETRLAVLAEAEQALEAARDTLPPLPSRHRLSRAGNRRLNHVLYMPGIVQLRNDTPGRAYYRRKLQQSKTSMEAMRCLRRRLSDVVYRQLVADAAVRRPATGKAGPGGHPGTTLKSSAADLTPDIGSSDQPLPGPAPSTLPD